MRPGPIRHFGAGVQRKSYFGKGRFGLWEWYKPKLSLLATFAIVSCLTMIGKVFCLFSGARKKENRTN